MSDFVMTIAGDTVPADDSFGVVNPANGEVFAHAPECTPQQLDAAFDAASKAQRDWKSDESARRVTLLKMADVLLASSAELAPVLTAWPAGGVGDQGVPGPDQQPDHAQAAHQRKEPAPPVRIGGGVLFLVTLRIRIHAF